MKKYYVPPDIDFEVFNVDIFNHDTSEVDVEELSIILNQLNQISLDSVPEPRPQLDLTSITELAVGVGRSYNQIQNLEPAEPETNQLECSVSNIQTFDFGTTEDIPDFSVVELPPDDEYKPISLKYEINPISRCSDMNHNPKNGTYYLKNGDAEFVVPCVFNNFDSFIVIQNRLWSEFDWNNARFQFTKATLRQYESGFGYMNANFWLGLNKFHILSKYSNGGAVILSNDNRIQKFYYDILKVGNKENKFRLTVAGDDEALMKSNGKSFSMGNDIKCATSNYGGWWFSCHEMGLYTHLNGKSPSDDFAFNNFWFTWEFKNEQFYNTHLLIRF